MLIRLAGTAFFSGLGALFTRGAQFVCTLIYARFLIASDFGVYGLIQTTVLLFTTFFALSFGQLATRLVAQAKLGDTSEVASAVATSYIAGIFISLPFAILLFVFSGVISGFLTNSFDFEHLFYISALLVPLITLIAIQNGVALGLGLGAARRVAIVNILITPFIVLVGYFSALTGDIAYILLAYILNQVAIVLIQQYSINKNLSELQLCFSNILQMKVDWGPIIKFGVPSSFAGLLTLPANWIVMAFVSRQDGGLIEIGYFAFASQFKAIVYFLIGTVAGAALPQLSEMARLNNKPGYISLIKKSVFFLVSFMVVITSLTWVLAPPVIEYIAPRFVSAAPVLTILVGACIFVCITSVMMRSAAARGSAVETLAGNFSYSIALISLSFLLKDWGALGLAVATLAASVLQAFVILIGEMRVLSKWKVDNLC